MSMPNIPDIDFNKEQGAALIMASIGMQELGLSHIVNAEGEKIQSFLGTLEDQEINDNITLEDLISLDNAVIDTLDSVAKNELILYFKLNEVKKLLETPVVETLNYVALIIWDDNNNSGSTRPEALEVYLYRNGVLYQTKTIPDTLISNTNAITFYNLPKYDNAGNEYDYTIDEEDSIYEYYNKLIDDNTIINSLIPD